MEIIVRRAFSPAYIMFDAEFLIFFLIVLIWKRKYVAATVGIIMGLVYMAIDYGIFHLLLGTRSIEGGSLFWTLLWMSMSYGFTNFVWIWLWLEKDENLFEWSFLILLWWFACPLLSSQAEASIVIERTTGAYHGYMAAILLVGYLVAILHNLREKQKEYRIDISWILTIGILVQLGWEAGLLPGGIRSHGLDIPAALRTLAVNSLLETNLGMPYAYIISIAVTSRVHRGLFQALTINYHEREDQGNQCQVSRAEERSCLTSYIGSAIYQKIGKRLHPLQGGEELPHPLGIRPYK